MSYEFDVEDFTEIEDDEKVTECEICGQPCDFIPFPCRDDDGNLAEIRGCCIKCHDEWCLCNCKKPYSKGNEKDSVKLWGH